MNCHVLCNSKNVLNVHQEGTALITHSVEYNAAIKKNGADCFAMTWKDAQKILTEKAKYGFTSITGNYFLKNTTLCARA